MAKEKNQYTVRTCKPGYSVLKMDDDFNFKAIYYVQEERGRWFCSCPNTMADVCRHIKMMWLFNKKRAVNKPLFYCYDTEEWTKVKDA